MNGKTILICVATCLVGFIGGFMFANTLNRSEAARQTAAVQAPDPQQTAPDQPRGPAALTPDEIKSKVAAADANPGDFTFQKGLGMSLYRYASVKQEASLLPDTIRILQRALDLDPADRDLQIALGNAHFDVGYFNKDNAALERSRVFYNKALERIPTDVDVRTDLALTYYLYQPPDLDTTVAEFEKGLATNPKHERALQFLVQAYAKKNERGKAVEALGRLKLANPLHPAIAELNTLTAGEKPPAAK